MIANKLHNTQANEVTHVLIIGGSDSTGSSGIQADITTVAALGAQPVTAISCIAIQNSQGIKELYDLPADITLNQMAAIMTDTHPRAIKLGLIRDVDTIHQLSKQLSGCNNIVIAPGIYASNGEQMLTTDAISVMMHCLIPQARLLMLRCKDIELMLHRKIQTDEDMVKTASYFHNMGAEWVLLRGGQHLVGRLTALLYGPGTTQFFTSYNTDGWQQHGVGGVLSTAITTRLALGDDVPAAISNAHEYVHSRVVYSVRSDGNRLRPADIYNAFMSLLTAQYRQHHDVLYYASQLNITTRYLSQITNNTVGKAPKQIIADYLLHEAHQMLGNSRLTIKEVADALGFSTTALFCKFFRQQQGLTPSEFRLSVESLP